MIVTVLLQAPIKASVFVVFAKWRIRDQFRMALDLFSALASAVSHLSGRAL